MDSVQLAFYSGKGNNPVLAYLVNKLTGDFVHVEIIFRDNDSYYCSSIEQNNTVYFKKKSYGRKDWSYITISNIDTEKVRRMRNYCFKIASCNNGFDLNAMVRSITPFPKQICSGFFCSMYVAEVLQKGGFLAGIISSSVTPSSLFRIVNKEFQKKDLYKSANPYWIESLACGGENKLKLDGFQKNKTTK
jgi:hypothetical protein